ncbi:MAG: hypothetical protein ACERKN_08040 [Velocimicrobium sp.]
MSIEEIRKAFVYDYFVIVTGTVAGTFIFCLILDKNATFSLLYFGWVLLFSFLADIPLFIFYSKKELPEHKWRIRIVLHFIVLEALLLLLAYIADMYENIVGGMFFAIIVAGVYVMVRFIGHQMNLRLAIKMNERLKRIQEE